MARVLLPTNTLVGRSLLQISQQIISLQQDVARLQAVKNAIGAGNLETSPEALIPTGSGASVAGGIDQIFTAMSGLATLVATIDQG